MNVGLVWTSVTESSGIESRPGTKASWLAVTSGMYAASVNTGPAITGATGSGRVSPASAGTRAAASLATVLAGCRESSRAVRAPARSRPAAAGSGPHEPVDSGGVRSAHHGEPRVRRLQLHQHRRRGGDRSGGDRDLRL